METNKNIFDQFQLKEKPRVPEGYFENLAARVMQEAKQEQKPTLRVFYKRPVFWLSAAAASVVLFLGIRVFTQPEELDFKDLSDHEILAYVEEHLDDIDAEQLIEKNHSDSQENESTTQQTQEENTSSSGNSDSLSNEEILHYLNSQEIDLEDLEDLY